MSRARASIEKILSSTSPKGRYLLAVSGGIDSSVLLHAFSEIRDKKQLHLEVAHVDHGLRLSSNADAKFVKAQCQRLKIVFHLKKLKPPAKGTNLEDWGRRQRYAFFEEIRQKSNLEWILTAHNADDVLETFLMRLISNKEPRLIEAKDLQRKLYRPLLLIPRSAIAAYAKRQQLTHVEDCTNQAVTFLRNKVRHRLLPYLVKQFGPQVLESLALRSLEISRDLDYFDQQASALLEPLAAQTVWSKVWKQQLLAVVNSCSPRIAVRVIQQVLYPKLGFTLGLEHAERVVVFLQKSSQEQIQLPGGLKLVKRAGGLRWE